MVRTEFWPGPHWVTDAEADAIRAVAEEEVSVARTALPSLLEDIYVLVHQTHVVMEDTGSGGYTIGPQVIRWDIDPARGMVDVALSVGARSTLLHECHHAARLAVRPGDVVLDDWRAAAVFEGLASVFEGEVSGVRAPWREYDKATIAAWADELFGQPIDENAWHWRFRHPDGRSSILYRVGSWIVDRATEASGQTAASLATAPPQEVFALAELPW